MITRRSRSFSKTRSCSWRLLHTDWAFTEHIGVCSLTVAEHFKDTHIHDIMACRMGVLEVMLSEVKEANVCPFLWIMSILCQVDRCLEAKFVREYRWHLIKFRMYCRKHSIPQVTDAEADNWPDTQGRQTIPYSLISCSLWRGLEFKMKTDINKELELIWNRSWASRISTRRMVNYNYYKKCKIIMYRRWSSLRASSA